MSDWTFSKNKPKQSQSLTAEDRRQKTIEKIENKPNLVRAQIGISSL